MATLSPPSSPHYPSPATGPVSATSSLVPVPPDPELERALAGLVADGTLTAEQAHAVRSSRAVLLARQQASPVTEATPPGQRARRHNPLPVVLGWVGAALVGSAGLSLVLRSWETWSDTARLALLAPVTVALYAAAAVAVASTGGRSRLAESTAVRRRLVALLLGVGAVLAGVTAVVWLSLLGHGGAPWLALAAGAVALGAATMGAWVVRGALSTLAVAAGTIWLTAGAVALAPAPGDQWYLPLVATGAGACWLALAPRLLAVPVLSEALGWALMLQASLSYGLWAGPGEDAIGDAAAFDAMQVQAWVARGILVVLAVVGMLAFQRGGRWPWAAGGVTAGVGAALGVAGQALDWVVAMMLAGVVLLLLSGLLVAMRRRGDRGT